MRTVRGRADHVVVVGAGLSGLAAALHLAGRGRAVTVLERYAVPGGRAGRLDVGRYRLDTGPAVLTMPDIVADTLAAVGDSLPARLPLVRLDPAYRARPRSSSICGVSLDRVAGLRRGEAAGLRWCDVDLDEGVAVISQQLQQYDGHIVASSPKTRHSSRVIALDRTTITALRQHRARQIAEHKIVGKSYRDSGYVFTSLVGDPIVPDRLTRTFHRLCEDAGMPVGCGNRVGAADLQVHGSSTVR
jgi:integrase